MPTLSEAASNNATNRVMRVWHDLQGSFARLYRGGNTCPWGDERLVCFVVNGDNDACTVLQLGQDVDRGRPCFVPTPEAGGYKNAADCEDKDGGIGLLGNGYMQAVAPCSAPWCCAVIALAK
jgi:hypothetical protein